MVGTMAGYPKYFDEHQVWQGEVRNACVASLYIPDLEPERRARIEEIRAAVATRMCTTKPEDPYTCGANIRAAREELAWLRADPRLDMRHAF
jgi:hypothetical protein